MIKRILLSFILPILLLFLSCAGKKGPVYKTEPAHNRTMGIVIVGQADDKLAELVEKGIKDLYGPRVIKLTNLAEPFEEFPPSLLSDAAVKSVDDIIIVRTKHSLSEESDIMITIDNLGSLKRMADFGLPNSEETPIALRKELASKLPNPGSFPKLNRLLLAANLENRKYLEDALIVYKIIRKEDYSILLQDIDEKDAMDRKITAIERKIKLKQCRLEDSKAVFDLKFDQKGLSDDNAAKLISSINDLKLKEYLKKYTRKPTTFKVRYDSKTNKGSIRFEMRYWPKWYRINTKRIPKYVGTKRVISFKSYFGLMKRLVKIKESFAEKVSRYLKQDILNFEIALVLTKPCDETLELTVATGEGGFILHPYYLRVDTTDFNEVTLEAGDKKIFNETGMFVLGPAKLLSGERTNWGVLYDFLEISE